MRYLAILLFSWFLRHFLNFLLIIAILVAGKFLWSSYENYKEIEKKLEVLESTDEIGNDLYKEYLDKYIREPEYYLTLSEEHLKKIIDKIKEDKIKIIDLSQLYYNERKKYGEISILMNPGLLQISLELDIKIAVLNKSIAYLDAIESLMQLKISVDSDQKELEEKRKILSINYAALQEKKSDKHREGCNIYIHHTKCTKDIRQLEKKLHSNEKDIDFFKDEIRSSQEKLRSLHKIIETFDFKVKGAFNNYFKLKDEIIKKRNSVLLYKIFEFIKDSIENVFKTAVTILVFTIVTPVAIKLFFYYILAPLAERRPPMQLIPGREAMVSLKPHDNAGPARVAIDKDHELLIDSEFLPGVPIDARKQTQWLLNYKLPFTSLAAGKVALTRIQSDRPETIVVASIKNPLAGVGIVDVPENASFVIQPHNLAGVVKPRKGQIHISRHWRIGTLHAWLTLQLRYLAIHGPAQLVVHGCPRVCCEQPDEGGRQINQASTLGFSGNLQYSTRRSETFIAYLSGKKELLDDMFRGRGSVVYQQVPFGGKKSGLFGRGMEGIVDSFLKILGI